MGNKANNILKILNNCTDPNAYMNDVEISAENLKAAIDVHSKQCPSIFYKAIHQDKGLKKLITISHELGKPYLSYLVDTYNRDRVMFINNDDSIAYGTKQWARTNKHMMKINQITNECQAFVCSIQHLQLKTLP